MVFKIRQKFEMCEISYYTRSMFLKLLRSYSPFYKDNLSILSLILIYNKVS